MSATVEVSYRQVLRNHRLALLLLGDVASRIGDGMIVVALPLQTLRIHDGMHPAVAIALIEAAPYAIAVPLSLFFGLGRTRFRPRTMVLADGILRLLTFTALGSLALVDALPLSVLGLALAAGSSLRLLAGSSRRLIATDLGGPRARFTINALLGTSDSLAFYVAGPVLGGTLAALLAPGPVLLLDGLCFLPLLGVALLAIPAVTGHHADHEGEPTSGWTILRQVPVAAWLFAVVFCFNLFYMPVEVSLPLLVRGPLHGSDAALGVLWTSFGIGALAGALATNQLRRLAPTRVLVGIIAGWACCVGLLTVAPDVTVAAIALGVGGLIYAPFIAVAYSLVQAALQPRQQQPVLTLWAAGATIAAPIGLAMAGPLVQLTGIRGGLAVSALLTIALVSPATRALHTRRSP